MVITRAQAANGKIPLSKGIPNKKTPRKGAGRAPKRENVQVKKSEIVQIGIRVFLFNRPSIYTKINLNENGAVHRFISDLNEVEVISTGKIKRSRRVDETEHDYRNFPPRPAPAKKPPTPTSYRSEETPPSASRRARHSESPDLAYRRFERTEREESSWKIRTVRDKRIRYSFESYCEK